LPEDGYRVGFRNVVLYCLYICHTLDKVQKKNIISVWIRVAQESFDWQGVVNMVTKFRITTVRGISWPAISYSGRNAQRFFCLFNDTASSQFCSVDW